ncbi:outer membrane porin, OprD family [Pseudomonas sp. FW306-02-F02-AA]|uniref:Porin n=1 Tax=Pseudomonas fluorescens TaxID=294 RepID=A0A0N9WEW2_PSEFL|nr:MULTISPECIES: OprD family porin [Pseudomonas]ALI00177.1 porin [Pseudomonas fluorescens]PMZ06063.1 outer membrane porin, OprD family [Pseudomonas sp. FW306-02-F02-AB]PMZ11706.1 outer membrane porin, OprD family [Pseudomonas sp. FW306-02-H06C]PMZ17628.1 outer membrane porin, OprD family [Pseudomonas sp. FW306-02-F02-AA]PMZ21248.1 outer membrane porin, OprD family [Pseudomonas sp. FW306-02-F08-AA]
MRVMKWSMIALAVTAATGAQVAMADPFVTDQADAKGFVEGASAGVVLKNYYFNRNNKNGAQDQKDWTQGVLGKFNSGYTQGTVGVGVEAYGDAAFKLDGTDAQSGTGNMSRTTLRDANGNVIGHDVNSQMGKAGAALKVRISKTELKVGDFTPSTAPVFAVGGSRMFQQTASGFQLQSSEIKNLDLEAGHFTGGSSQDQTRHNGELWTQYAGTKVEAADYLGGKYGINDNLSVSLYGAKFQDTWTQYYGNANYTIPLATDQSLNFDFNLYQTNDTGAAKAGKIDNTTYSLAAAYSFLKAHTVTLAFQQVHGDTPFDYIGVGDNNRGGDSIFLANSIQYSDFNGPEEKSIQVRYDLKMAEYGVPGLSFMARYAHGQGIDGTKMAADSPYRLYGYGEDGRHNETNLEAKYVVQSGPLKDLSFRARQAWHRGNNDQAEGNIDEFRLITEYPINIL